MAQDIRKWFSKGNSNTPQLAIQECSSTNITSTKDLMEVDHVKPTSTRKLQDNDTSPVSGKTKKLKTSGLSVRDAPAGRGLGGWVPGFPPHKGEKEPPQGAANCLEGLTFVISGTLDSLEREEAEDLIKRHSGRVTGAISKKTRYLLCDEDTGVQKCQKAKELGIKFITEDGLFDMIRASVDSQSPESKATLSPQQLEKTEQAEGSSCQQKSWPETLFLLTEKYKPQANTKGVISSSSSQQKSRSDDHTSLLLTEKYRPESLIDIVGNQHLVKQLYDWLYNWNERFLISGNTQSYSATKKAILLSGPPGIGKTTSARVVCKMLGYQAIEVNASDSRGKSDSIIRTGIAGSISNSVKELVSNETISLKIARSQRPKTVLIMDEVDGMTSGDRGGVADLIASIKMSKVPIICICNDKFSQKIRSLVKYCSCLNFQRPRKEEVKRWLAKIVAAEVLQVNETALEELAERANGDIRMALNQLQFIGLSMPVTEFGDMKQRLQFSSKNENISPFEAVSRLHGLHGGMLGLNERFDLIWMTDINLPLYIQENYLDHRPHSVDGDQYGMRRMSLIAMAAESIVDGDIINTHIRKHLRFQLSEVGSLTSSIIPGSFIRGQQGLNQAAQRYTRFPASLGKMSTMKKNRRLLKELHAHLLSSRRLISRQALQIDQLTLLWKKLTDPLNKLDKDEAVEHVLKFMDLYSISKDDFETVGVLSKYVGHTNPLAGIQPAIKAALTRAYNKRHPVIKDAYGLVKKALTKRAAKMLEPVDHTSSEEDDSEEEDDTEDEEELIDTKKLISNLEKFNSEAIQVQVTLNGSGSTSAKARPSGRGRGCGSGSAVGRLRNR